MKRRINYLLTLSIIFGLNLSQLFAEDKVFFGNLHSHTSYSDGSGKPCEAFNYAKNTAKIDFLALTEHNHAEALGDDNIGIATDQSLYKGSRPDSLISCANNPTLNNQFVALYGQEFSTISSGNHVNVFDVGEVINVPKGRFDLLLDFLNKPVNLDSSGQSALIMFNHPKNSLAVSSNEYGLDDFNGNINQWVVNMSKYAGLIQIINGPGMSNSIDADHARPDEDAYLKFLNLGYKLAPTADQDNHQKNWGNATTARTAAIMETLSKANLMKALKSRHVYATEDKNLRIIIKVNDKLCGDVISPLPPASELKISYSIRDQDEPDADYEIQVWRDAVGGGFAQMVSAVQASQGGTGTIEDIAFSGQPEYFFFKIIQHGDGGTEDRAWTAPVWFEQQSNPQPNVAAVSNQGETEADGAVASRNSEVFHISDSCLDAKRIKQSNLVRGGAARIGRRQHENCPRLTNDQ